VVFNIFRKKENYVLKFHLKTIFQVLMALFSVVNQCQFLALIPTSNFKKCIPQFSRSRNDLNQTGKNNWIVEFIQ